MKTTIYAKTSTGTQLPIALVSDSLAYKTARKAWNQATLHAKRFPSDTLYTTGLAKEKKP